MTDSPRIELDLSGNHWKMERMRPGQGEVEGLHDVPSEYQGIYYSWNQASVPGDVFSDLQRAGEIDDPFFGRQFGRAKWVNDHEWWYVCKFNAPEAMRGKRVTLVFEGVDYSFAAWLNGKPLGSHAGMYSSFRPDITHAVRFEEWNEGCNILMLRLDPAPKNLMNVQGRKHCFQGDYQTGVVPTGIWRPVKVVATGAVSIEHLRVETPMGGLDHEGPDEPGSAMDATAKVQVELKQALDYKAELSFTATVRDADGTTVGTATHSAAVRAGGSRFVDFEVPLKGVHRWWPWDLGEQPLYDIEVAVSVDGAAHDARTERFGVREVVMDRNPGYTQEEAEFPWTFMVNGKRHYLRGACWSGPPSLLYGRNTLKKYEDRIKWVREANINHLRIFGWHPPEIPDFYRLCDEAGITVWTNFTFATQALRATPEFMAGAEADCIHTVKDRRNHASAIFFMGGEESFFSHAHAESDNREIMERIGEVIAPHTSTAYGLASPLSEAFGQTMGFKAHDSTHANGHYYGAGRTMMEDFYPKLDYCIVPELTAASAPNIDSLKRFIPENELWPMGPSWGYHHADLDILRTLNYEVFGDLRDDTLEHFVSATQGAHGVIAHFALESLRRLKPKNSGIGLCHFITHWPDIKWGIVDYYGEKKTCFDNVKRAYQPVLPSLDYVKRRWNPGETFDGGLFVVNDTFTAYPGATLAWNVTGPGGASASGKVNCDVDGDSGKEFGRMTWEVPTGAKPAAGSLYAVPTFAVALKLTAADGTVIAENEHVLLVDDQAEAKAEFGRLDDATRKKWGAFGKSYYRYHPELWDLDGGGG